MASSSAASSHGAPGRCAGEPWLLVPFAWLPAVELQRKADTDRVPYIQWRAEGYLDTTPGRAIRKRVILQKL